MKGVSDEELKVFDGVCAAIGRAVIGLDELGHPISKELIVSALEQMKDKVAKEGGFGPAYLEVAIKKMKG
ncbi:hypothetical protein [Yersinia ruckeri]|uniref:hypothetical protein n=1 Tax=Yersinia ruckeri TaxID=29486 RepID=UPI0008FDBBED|nr:hypothetical protein [Yersinia ruckeri]OJB95767.1 hypothetical protein AXW59_07430 [Yersinia ruckeri]OJB98568.1 hypothetical protein AXW58_07410 [Yersinia ruckeri]OJC00216.1 hypothetical protein AXW57_07425 [Yersinia ruckeri]